MDTRPSLCRRAVDNAVFIEEHTHDIADRGSRHNNAVTRVRPPVCLSLCLCPLQLLNRLTFDL